MEKIVDKVVQLYMENDYDYVVSKAKAGFRMPKQLDGQMVQFLKRNSIVPADMLEEDIQKVADIATKRIDEIEAEIYKKYQLR
jgi:spore coat polysaccharide biosynthesis protein SpsF (cytidylyltransferase family)